MSRLIERAVNGKPFVIAKAGRSLVKVTALDVPPARQTDRRGFMGGQIAVPDDFDRMGGDEIEQAFCGCTVSLPGQATVFTHLTATETIRKILLLRPWGRRRSG